MKTMGKKMIYAMLVCGIAMYSCDKDPKDQNGVKPGELVEVSTGLLGSGVDPNEVTGDVPEDTRTAVTADGATIWSTGDFVYIIDVDGTPQRFDYNNPTASTEADFRGRLLDRQGVFRYPAAFIPKGVDGKISSGAILTIKRADIAGTENGDLLPVEYGAHSPMVAVPSTFDVESSRKKLIDFYHATSMISARIQGTDSNFDFNFTKIKFVAKAYTKAEFATMVAPGSAWLTNPLFTETPFNNELEISLKRILGDYKGFGAINVVIPYTEGKNKTDEISTTITFKERKNLKAFIESKPNDNTYYGIPLICYPTKSYFAAQYTLEFYDGAVKVKTMKYKNSKGNLGRAAEGLQIAGLNILDFCTKNIVFE